MVAKIEIGNTLYGTVKYNAQKVNDGEAKVLLANKIFYSTDGRFDVAACVRDFENHMPIHTKTKSPVIHISLNPHPDDRLSEAQMAAIAEEYMERLGYGNQPYIVYKHEDISRHHMHIISLRVDARGRKIDDRFEHRRSKDITRDLEQKYGLHRAERRGQREAMKPRKVDALKGDVKRQVGSVVRFVAPRYDCQSFTEYRALLSLYNIAAEEVKGEANGKPFSGVVYSATDDSGVKKGNPFKSSIYGKSVGYEALQARFERAKTQVRLENVAGKTKLLVVDALRHSSSREEFREELKKRGVDVVFRESDAGRLYGVTYVDHTNSCVLNGSRLGRDLSANALSERFENPQNIEPREEREERQTQQTRQTQQPQIEQHSEQQQLFEYVEEETLSIGGVFDIPDCEADPEEEQIANAIQRRRVVKQKRIKF